MAATGLLGINPYQKGVSLDITSKPLQATLQIQQHEQAKNEALDKYFMDMDKNVNLAGVRSIDQNAVLQKLAENRDLFFKNKDAIRNPEKYGTELYNKYMNNYRDALGIVNKSKEAVGQLKALQTLQAQAKAKGEVIDDNVLHGIADMEHSVIDPNYRPFDMANFSSYKPHDPYEFQKELKTLNTIPGKPEKVKEGNYMFWRTPMDADVNNVVSFSTNKLGNAGYTKMLNNLTNEDLNTLDKVYQQRFNRKLDRNNIKDVSLAYTYTNLPKDYTQTHPDITPEYNSFLINSRKTPTEGTAPQGNILDSIGGAGVPVMLGKDKYGNQYKVEYGEVLGKDNSKFSGVSSLKGSELPAEFYSIMNKAGVKLSAADNYKVKSKDGVITEIETPRGKITRQFIENAQLAAYSEPKKAPQPGFGTGGKSKSKPQYRGIDKNGNPIYN